MWIAAEAAPFALVKAETKNQTRMLLTGLLNDVKDKVTGTPRPLKPREGMWDKGPPKDIVGSYNWMYSLLWYVVDAKSQKQ